MKSQSFFRTAVAALLLTGGLFFTNCQGPLGEPTPQGETGVTATQAEFFQDYKAVQKSFNLPD